jgi:hypothetical protein
LTRWKVGQIHNRQSNRTRLFATRCNRFGDSGAAWPSGPHSKGTVFYAPKVATGFSPEWNGTKIRVVWEVLAWERPLGTQHRLEAYATLTFRSVKRCLKSSCREIRGPTATTPTGQCSIGFQPVSGFPTGNIWEIASQPLNPRPIWKQRSGLKPWAESSSPFAARPFRPAISQNHPGTISMRPV